MHTTGVASFLPSPGCSLGVLSDWLVALADLILMLSSFFPKVEVETKTCPVYYTFVKKLASYYIKDP